MEPSVRTRIGLRQTRRCSQHDQIEPEETFLELEIRAVTTAPSGGLKEYDKADGPFSVRI